MKDKKSEVLEMPIPLVPFCLLEGTAGSVLEISKRFLRKMYVHAVSNVYSTCFALRERVLVFASSALSALSLSPPGARDRSIDAARRGKDSFLAS